MVAHGACVLVVDDEPEILDLMRDFLEADGFQVRTAANAREAVAAIAGATVDCMLVDVMMPGTSGFELCRQLRQQTDVPIIFLTARDGGEDKIRGLGLGADDYVVKSATAGEVVARIKAVLRRYRGPSERSGPPSALEFGRLVIDVRAHEARVDGQAVPLTAKEFAVLQLLAEHPRQVFTREQLMDRLWGTYGDGHTVTVTISKLREKIELDPASPRQIVTVWGVGYRFEAGR
jgi:DNA-binding response OmpR family regulator